MRNVLHYSVFNNAGAANAIEIQHVDSGGPTTRLWKGQLEAGEGVKLDENGDWTVYTSNGIQKLPSQAPDIQVFSAAGAQTWTKPTSFTPKVVGSNCSAVAVAVAVAALSRPRSSAKVVAAAVAEATCAAHSPHRIWRRRRR